MRGKLTLTPVKGVAKVDHDTFHAEVADNFLYADPKKVFPKGNSELLWLIETDIPNPKFKLFLDSAEQEAENPTLDIPFQPGIAGGMPLFVPEDVTRFRLNLMDKPGVARVRYFAIQTTSQKEIIFRVILRNLRRVTSWHDLKLLVRKAVDQVRRTGTEGLIEKIIRNNLVSYEDWIKRYDQITLVDLKKAAELISSFQTTPIFSVVVPVHNTQPTLLHKAVASVRNQVYPHWELILVDDHSSSDATLQALKEAASQNERIRVIHRETNGHIAAATNTGIQTAIGDFVAFMDHDDELRETALFHVAAVLNEQPNLNLIYSDEDKVDEQGNRYDPYFKPDWNPELLTGQNYFNHLTVYRRQLLLDLDGLREGFNGAQDWDLALRATESIPAETIKHIPFILYHWRAVAGSTALAGTEKDYIEAAQRNALEEHFKRTNQKANLTLNAEGYWRSSLSLDAPYPLVSIIIPTRNKLNLLKQTIDSVRSKTTYQPYEIIVIDNQSDDPETLRYLQEFSGLGRFMVLRYDQPFNYSAINNLGVKHARGEVVVLLNNDMEVITPDWLQEMVSLATKKDTGAVGAKLYYPDGRIQHGGVIVGLGGVAGHAYLHKSHDYPGQMGRARIRQNMSAVTGACMAVEKRKFVEVGGLNDADLKVAFNDIDLCLRLLQAGYRNVWSPFAELTHHESASRGSEDTPEKQARFKSEVEYMLRTWGETLLHDPAYNPNLSLDRQEFTLAFPPRVKKPWS